MQNHARKIGERLKKTFSIKAVKSALKNMRAVLSAANWDLETCLVFVHPNDQWKSLHSVIPPEVLPEEYGGKLKFDSCINLLEDIEELEDHFQEIFKFGYIKTKASRESFRPICRKN
ncbi:hypothetical protein AVEN_6806-1 [Araneus ventricosus]|uniref:CRAL-TRIO domain-containing protein n=1 Tax=Araneus ventricosus TaxID=182803 RepID=A0A4Y2I779_ARAVE|nr:hypothetical protein AVEN_6806-1 [Araneus ventricosus]